MLSKRNPFTFYLLSQERVFQKSLFMIAIFFSVHLSFPERGMASSSEPSGGSSSGLSVPAVPVSASVSGAPASLTPAAASSSGLSVPAVPVSASVSGAPASLSPAAASSSGLSVPVVPVSASVSDAPASLSPAAASSSGSSAPAPVLSSTSSASASASGNLAELNNLLGKVLKRVQDLIQDPSLHPHAKEKIKQCTQMRDVILSMLDDEEPDLVGIRNTISSLESACLQADLGRSDLINDAFLSIRTKIEALETGMTAESIQCERCETHLEELWMSRVRADSMHEDGQALGGPLTHRDSLLAQLRSLEECLQLDIQHLQNALPAASAQPSSSQMVTSLLLVAQEIKRNISQQISLLEKGAQAPGVLSLAPISEVSSLQGSTFGSANVSGSGASASSVSSSPPVPEVDDLKRDVMTGKVDSSYI